VTVCDGDAGPVKSCVPRRGVVQKFISKVSRLVTTKLLSAVRDIGCHAFREQFVTCA